MPYTNSISGWQKTMSYEKANDLLDLAIRKQSSKDGMSLNKILIWIDIKTYFKQGLQYEYTLLPKISFARKC